MRLNSLKRFLLFVLGLVMLGAGCKSKPPIEPPYSLVEGSVGFDAKLESGSAKLEEPTKWLATYKSGGRIAQFRIEFEGTKESSTTPIRISFGKGKFVAVPGSDATALMSELKKALEAKTLPAKVARVESVPFVYAIIGNDLYRGATDGGLSGDRKGNWIAVKLFLGTGDTDEGEVFLNMNPLLQKGEFSIKDSDYGDFVVGQLAKVL
jgi:hypothetical protein